MSWGLPQWYIALIWGFVFWSAITAKPEKPEPRRKEYTRTLLMAFMFPGSALALHAGGFW